MPLSVSLRIEEALSGPIASWEMIFGDGKTRDGTGAPPHFAGHTFTEDGDYNVLLVVNQSNDRRYTAIAQITAGAGGGPGGPPPPPPPPPPGSPPPATATATGTVLVGGRPFTGGTVPYNVVVDVTNGTLTLTTDTGKLKVFGEGKKITARFKLVRGTDKGKPIVELLLQGGNFSVCPKRKTSAVGATKAKDGALALGRRQGPLPHEGPLLLGDGPRHELADRRPLRRNLHEGPERASSRCSTSRRSARSASRRRAHTWPPARHSGSMRRLVPIAVAAAVLVASAVAGSASPAAGGGWQRTDPEARQPAGRRGRAPAPPRREGRRPPTRGARPAYGQDRLDEARERVLDHAGRRADAVGRDPVVVDPKKVGTSGRTRGDRRAQRPGALAHSAHG